MLTFSNIWNSFPVVSTINTFIVDLIYIFNGFEPFIKT